MYELVTSLLDWLGFGLFLALPALIVLIWRFPDGEE